jgi:hypothetical protein
MAWRKWRNGENERNNGEENNGENIENRKASKAKMASAAMAKKSASAEEKAKISVKIIRRRISGINGVINNIEIANCRGISAAAK